MQFSKVPGYALVSLIVGACAGSGDESGETVTGSCAGGSCTGVCVEEVQNYAREKLGTEATDVYFAFGDDDPAALSGVVVCFRTPDCPNGEYQAQFYGNSQSCSNVYRGALPDNVGKLLVVPEGCKG